MKTAYTALTIILYFQLFGIIQIGYGAIFMGYVITFFISLIIDFIVRILIAGYEQFEEEKSKK